MAVNNDALTRATRALAHEPLLGWTQLSTAIMRRVRATARPGETILAFAADGGPSHDEHGSRLYIAERVLVAALRRATTTATAAPERIDIVMDDDRCAAVLIHLVGSWDTDLQDAAEQAHRLALVAVHEVLGADPGFVAERDLHVTITDVDDPGPPRADLV